MTYRVTTTPITTDDLLRAVIDVDPTVCVKHVRTLPDMSVYMVETRRNVDHVFNTKPFVLCYIKEVNV